MEMNTAAKIETYDLAPADVYRAPMHDATAEELAEALGDWTVDEINDLACCLCDTPIPHTWIDPEYGHDGYCSNACEQADL